MPQHTDKERRKNVSKSLLSRMMSFGARDKAAKSKAEKFLSKKKKKEFSLKR